MSAPETLVGRWPEPHTCPAAAGRRHAAARALARRATPGSLQAAGWDVVAVGGPTIAPPHLLSGLARQIDHGLLVEAEAATLEALYARLWERAQEVQA